MKFIIDRDFRNITTDPEWITIDLTKENLKNSNFNKQYLDNKYSTNWRVVFASITRIFSENDIIFLLKKSFDEHFKSSEILNDLVTDFQIPQNVNSKKRERKNILSNFSTGIVVTAFFEWIENKKYLIEKNQIEDYLLSHTDFFYSIPFIDPSKIIQWNDRKQPWDKNSIESFVRNNVLIQVRYKNLDNKENSIALFFRKDLKLGKGKTGAQLSHGIISLLYQPTFRNSSLDEFKRGKKENILIYSVSSLKDLKEIEHMCQQFKVNNTLIIDAGHTQIEPGTATCIGVGPLPKIWLEILAFNMEAMEMK